MELWQRIIEALPELQETPNLMQVGIVLRDDSDGVGAYIEEWNYSKPIPDGFTVGKPEA